MRSQNCCGAVNVSEPAIRAEARRRVRKSRGEHATKQPNSVRMRLTLRIGSWEKSGLAPTCDCNQTGGTVRQERMRRDLSTEVRGPSTRDRGRASRALPIRRDAVTADLVAEALDEGLSTVGAACVF